MIFNFVYVIEFVSYRPNECPCGLRSLLLKNSLSSEQTRNDLWNMTHGGKVIMKKMSSEKKYKSRFIWLSHLPGKDSCQVRLHWAKGGRKDYINKFMQFSDIKYVISAAPLKGSPRLDSESEDLASTCFTLQHFDERNKKLSLDLQCESREDRDSWVKCINWILGACDFNGIWENDLE